MEKNARSAFKLPQPLGMSVVGFLICSAILNVFVCIHTYRRRSRRTAETLLTCNLAFVDILLTVADFRKFFEAGINGYWFLQNNACGTSRNESISMFVTVYFLSIIIVLAGDVYPEKIQPTEKLPQQESQPSTIINKQSTGDVPYGKSTGWKSFDLSVRKMAKMSTCVLLPLISLRYCRKYAFMASNIACIPNLTFSKNKMLAVGIHWLVRILAIAVSGFILVMAWREFHGDLQYSKSRLPPQEDLSAMLGSNRSRLRPVWAILSLLSFTWLLFVAKDILQMMPSFITAIIVFLPMMTASIIPYCFMTVLCSCSL